MLKTSRCLLDACGRFIGIFHRTPARPLSKIKTARRPGFLFASREAVFSVDAPVDSGDGRRLLRLTGRQNGYLINYEA
jgi:hypothetical protein